MRYTRRRGVSAFEDERPGAGNQPSPAETGWVEAMIAKAHSSADANGHQPQRPRSALDAVKGGPAKPRRRPRGPEVPELETRAKFDEYFTASEKHLLISP